VTKLRFRWRLPQVLLALACLFAVVPAARAEPANTLREMFGRLHACLDEARSVDELAGGSEVTIVLALKRDGSLLGKPRIAHSALKGDQPDQAAFVAAVAAAIERCLPLEITPSLGGAIAGRPLALRVVKGRFQLGA